MRYGFILLFGVTLLCPLAALPDGDYLYSFTRTTDFPDLEKQYGALGITYRTVTVETVTGIVVTVREGWFTDPTLGMVLAVDSRGRLSAPHLGEIRGTLNEEGRFTLSGYRDHSGQRVRLVAAGSLMPITARDRADASLDGLYLLEEEIHGKKMAARIKGGYLTFEPLEGAPAGEPRSGWPLLVRGDGSILSVNEFITRVEVNGSRGDSSTFLTIEGRAAPSALSLVFLDSTATTTDLPSTSRRRVFGGLRIQEAELGRVPPDPGTGAVAAERIPDWYLNPEAGSDTLAAAGCKQMSDRYAALQAAETAAAAGLAFQVRTRVVSSVTLWSRTAGNSTDNETAQRLESTAEQTAYLTLDYTVWRSFYDEESRTAWVVVTMKKEKAESAVRDLFAGEPDQAAVSTALEEAF